MAWAVISQLLTMMLIMMVGFILAKKKYLLNVNVKGLSVVLTRIAVPANMVLLMQREYSHEILSGFLKAGAATLIMCIVGTLVFFIAGKMLKMNFPALGLFAGGGVYSNVIFMGQPLVMAMFGEAGLIFCVAVMFMSNIYLFTVCSVLFSMGCGVRKSTLQMLKDAFLNLICLSAVIGIFCFVKSVSLPLPILNALQAAANTTVCLSMVVIGSLLAQASLASVLKDKSVYIFSFLTLIMMPILTKLIVGTFLDGMALKVVIILMGTPAAAALPSFAEQYGNDEKRASELVFVSTIISVITLPLIANFYCS